MRVKFVTTEARDLKGGEWITLPFYWVINISNHSVIDKEGKEIKGIAIYFLRPNESDSFWYFTTNLHIEA